MLKFYALQFWNIGIDQIQFANFIFQVLPTINAMVTVASVACKH